MQKTPPTSPPAGIEARLRDELETVPEVPFAYLFGSLAKGRGHAGSDVDLAVWLDPDALPSAADRADRALDLEARLERLVGRPVQVVVLNDAPPELTHNVLEHGRLLRDADPAARRRHFVGHCTAWLDLEVGREIFGRAMSRRIEEGRFGG